MSKIWFVILNDYSVKAVVNVIGREQEIQGKIVSHAIAQRIWGRTTTIIMILKNISC